MGTQLRDLSAQLMKCGVRDSGVVHVCVGPGLKAGGEERKTKVGVRSER